MIQQVESFRPELYMKFILQKSVILENRKIDVLKPGAPQRVAS